MVICFFFLQKFSIANHGVVKVKAKNSHLKYFDNLSYCFVIVKTTLL